MGDQKQSDKPSFVPILGPWWKAAKFLIATLLLFFGIKNAVAFHDMHDFYATGGADFKIYLTAAEILDKGKSSKLYDYALQWETQAKLYPTWPMGNGPLPYNHPAAEALVFLPLAGTDVVTAYDRWILLNVFLLLGSFWLLRVELQDLNSQRIIPPVLWAAAFFPVTMGFLLGQDSILILFLYSVFYHQSCRGNHHWAGLAVGLCTFKPQLALPFAFLYFLCRRRWSGLAGFLFGGSAIGAFSVALVGVQGMKDFVALNALTQEYRPWLFNSRLMPQVRGLVQSIFNGWFSYSQMVGVVIIVSLGIMIGAALWVLYLPKVRPHVAGDSHDLEFAFCAIITVLVSYHLYPYDLSMLLIPVLLVINRTLSGNKPMGTPIWILLTAIGSLFFLPLHLVAVANLYYFLFAFVLLLLAWVIGRWMMIVAQHENQAFSTSTKQS